MYVQAEAEARAAVAREAVAVSRHEDVAAELAVVEVRAQALQAQVSTMMAECRAGKEQLAAAQRAEQDVAAELAVARAANDARAEELALLKAQAKQHRQDQDQQTSVALQERHSLLEEKEALLKQVGALEQALKETSSDCPESHAFKQVNLNSTWSTAPDVFDVSRFPESPKTNGMDILDIDSMGSATKWQRDSFFEGIGGPGAKEHGRSDTAMQPPRVSALEERVTVLQEERDGLADELAATVTRLEAAQEEAGLMHTLRAELTQLGNQYTLVLELLGATEEEMDDLRVTLGEARIIYRQELQRLMDMIPQSQKWEIREFPSPQKRKERGRTGS